SQIPGVGLRVVQSVVGAELRSKGLIANPGLGVVQQVVGSALEEASEVSGAGLRVEQLVAGAERISAELLHVQRIANVGLRRGDGVEAAEVADGSEQAASVLIHRDVVLIALLVDANGVIDAALLGDEKRISVAGFKYVDVAERRRLIDEAPFVLGNNFREEAV